LAARTRRTRTGMSKEDIITIGELYDLAAGGRIIFT
jgi:hypothetical protein